MAAPGRERIRHCFTRGSEIHEKEGRGWLRCQPPQFPEGFHRYKLPIIEYEALPFSKTRLENGQSLGAFRTSSVETGSRRNIDSLVEWHDPGRTDNASLRELLECDKR